MTTRTRPVTAEELLMMPDDGFLYELLRGELRKMSPAGHQHGKVAMRIGWRLARHVVANDLGEVYAAETGFKIASNPDTVRAPDVALVSRPRVEAVGDVEGYWPGAPDMAAEVLSPEDTYTELEEKVVEWLSAGTCMVIVLDPRKRTATVYRSLTDIVILSEERALDGGEVVPGWTVPVAELFG
ncbi:MAG: Uma2 family endonuclease [Deinococcota bacterium]|jgi:Uma2 family endonuclease|nr:Uma2 family endonuclease [Deinococcota bacterium]